MKFLIIGFIVNLVFAATIRAEVRDTDDVVDSDTTERNKKREPTTDDTKPPPLPAVNVTEDVFPSTYSFQNNSGVVGGLTSDNQQGSVNITVSTMCLKYLYFCFVYLFI